MSTTFTSPKQSFVMPIPKIGNHPEGCSCNVCSNARKRLAKSPYVQHLQRLVLQFHGEWQQAMGAGLEITQEATKLQQDLHAEGKELAWAEDNLTDFASISARLAVQLETMTAERDALKTERDGYVADLKRITEEANKQRKAADDAKALLKPAHASIQSKERELESVRGRERELKAELESAQEIIDEQKQSLELYQVHSIGARFLYVLVVFAAAALGLGAGIVAGRNGR